MLKELLYVVLQLQIIFLLTKSEFTDKNIFSLLCQTQTESCTECLNFHSNCSWCYDLEFNNERCDLAENLSELKCDSIYVGKKSNLEYEQNLGFRDVTEKDENAIQIRPQRVKLRLRPGDSKTIKLKYQIAKNYPLDLYYLMDATFTMKDDLEMLTTLGDDLTHSLSNLTQYFRIGFGTFSDKVLMPFTRMDDVALENPCFGSVEGFCSPGFNFWHQFSLNRNVQGFIDKVNRTRVTANLDNAEGAMDALMQILVCGERIGWKNESRKLVLLLTNGLLHLAGDGKLAGLAQKADGFCHLDEKGFYKTEREQDYPSLEEIYRKLKKHKTNVIFAVTEAVFDYYKKLNELIPNYSYVTQLHSDSSNILNVIKKGYEDVVSIVEFQDNATDPIELAYYSTCNKQFNKLNKTSACYDVKEGEKYEFDLKIRLQKCPDKSSDWKQIFIIDETHLETESVTVEIEMMCGCKCDDVVKKDPSCNFNGDIECGTCKCYPGWSGKNCNCDMSNIENNRMLENICREITENTTSIMCYGNGDCICGKCECESMYSGKYCNCRRCDRLHGQECGGPMRGLCSCGTCLCMPGYAGPNCLCPTDKETCIAPGDKEECSGHGSCHCGKCECASEPFKFSGNYCEKCSTCAGLCHLYEKCARCTIQNSCKEGDCGSTEAINSISFVSEIEEGGNACLVQVDKEYCPYWTYIYDLNKNNTVNLRIVQQGCHPPLGAKYYAGGAFCIVVFLGLLVIIIYKVVQKQKDAKEYAIYMTNLKTTSYNENPYYKSPKTEYKMPDRKSVV